MRILVATDSFPPKIDGVSDTARKIAEQLGKRGHRVTVLAPAPGEKRGTGYAVRRLRSVPCPLYPELRLAFGYASLWRAARERWDGVIVLTPGPIGLATVLSLGRQTPVLNIYTTDIPQYLRTYGLDPLVPPAEGILRWMAGRSTRTLSPTRFVHDDLARRGFARLEIWGRGVDMALFNPSRRSAEMRARLSGGEVDAPLVAFVGRLAREKNVLQLSEVARLLPGVRFAIVGDGPERHALERAFEGLPVTFTGYLRGEELASAFASADVFLFPSESETFGQVVLQAMASGVPPVVVAGSAPAEFVPPGTAGLHVPPSSPAAMAAAVRRLIDSPGLRTSMATAAAERARCYSWEALMDRLEVLLGRPAQPVPAGTLVQTAS